MILHFVASTYLAVLGYSWFHASVQESMCTEICLAGQFNQCPIKSGLEYFLTVGMIIPSVEFVQILFHLICVLCIIVLYVTVRNCLTCNNPHWQIDN